MGDGPVVQVQWWCGHWTNMEIPIRDGVGALHSQQIGDCPACQAANEHSPSEEEA